jgi:hypothetical protein
MPAPASPCAFHASLAVGTSRAIVRLRGIVGRRRKAAAGARGAARWPMVRSVVASRLGARVDFRPMQSVLQALQSLQEVDRDLFKVLVELKRLPEEDKRRKAALDKLSARATELRNEAKALRVKSKELDDRATIARQRLKKVDSEAMASRADQALLAAYDHERRTLKRDIGSAEEEGLALLEQVDVLEKQAVEAEAKAAAEQAVHAEFQQNMARELAAANARRAELEARRKERMGDGLPADTLALYVRVLATREGEALAQLDGRTCGACFMEVPTNMVVRVSRGADLVQCPSCDRILYI